MSDQSAPPEPVTDFLGNPVEVGTRIAVAARSGNDAVLRIAVVTGFGVRGGVWLVRTILVRWEELDGGAWEQQRRGSEGWIQADRVSSIFVLAPVAAVNRREPEEIVHELLDNSQFGASLRPAYSSTYDTVQGLMLRAVVEARK